MESIKAFFQQIEQNPAAAILERSCYDQLAQEGLSVFDKTQKQYTQVQDQWRPLLAKLLTDWYEIQYSTEKSEPLALTFLMTFLSWSQFKVPHDKQIL